MMTDIALAFFIGFLIGLIMRPKDKDLQEQQEIYNNKLNQHREDVEYYKNLCKWHVEKRKINEQNKSS